MKYVLRDKKEMKDSGVEWIGDIPEEWEVQRQKDFVKTHFGGTWGDGDANEDDGTLCVRVADFVYVNLRLKEEGFTYRQISKNYLNTKELKNGDLLLEKSGGGEKTPVGRIVRFDSGKSAVNSNFIETIRLIDSVDSKFFTYLNRAMYVKGVNVSFIKQTTGIQNLDVKSYLSEFIPAPDFKDQKRIANFLDEKTAVIDEVVKKKKKQIELLKEKRAALITQAVTKGLDPNVKMKDSGVEWIGEVPEGWNLVRLRRVVSLNPSKQESKHISEDSDVTFLPMTKVSSKGTFDKEVISKKSDVVTGFTYFRNGDVITAKITPCFENGKGALVSDLVNGIGFGSTEFIVVRPGSSINGTYLYYLIHSEMFRKSGEPWMYGSAGQQRVPDRFIKEFQAPLPQIEEQEKIVIQLDSGLNLLDRSIKTIQKSIKLIQEYRSSLISHAVTGKIKI